MVRRIISWYKSLFRKNSVVNSVAFFFSAVLSGYLIAFIPEGVRHGITSWEAYEYFFHESFPLVTVCAAAFALVLIGLAFLLGRIAIPSFVFCIISCGLGVANTNKIVYRGAPVLPTDIFLAKDALLATADYKIIIGKSFFLFLLLSLVLFLMMLPIRTPYIGKKVVTKLITSLICIAVCFAAAVYSIVSVYWDTGMLHKLGYSFTPKTIIEECLNNTFYPFTCRSLPVLFTNAPEGYSAKNMESLGQDINQYSAHANGGKEADIIILQLESYFYPDVYDLEYDRKEVFGALEGLALEGAHGSMVYSQIGGGTADVEFELLTGFTSNDSQCLVNPFSIYVTETTPSIVGYLKSKDYETLSIHSHSSRLYNRVNAYKAFGFEGSLFAGDFENPKMFGRYISEESCIDRVIEEYDRIIENGNKAFIHTVTMQNHITLTMDHYSPGDLVECSSSTLNEEQLEIARVYLTSCKEIGQQVVRLTEHIKETGRDAIVLIYGDHQAYLAKDYTETEVYAIPAAPIPEGMSDDEYFLFSHRTPFYVWSSFEYDGSSNLGTLAPNAVLATALKEFDVTRPAYYDFLLDSVNSFASITANYVTLADGSLSTAITDEQKSDNIERLLIQHDFLHGRKMLAEYVY